jgi:class 3 adenylate cyclase
MFKNALSQGTRPPTITWMATGGNRHQHDQIDFTGNPAGSLTFLFTDIEESTRLWEEHPTLMADALARHDDILTAMVCGRGGRIFSWRGDGLAAAFERAETALDAAIAAQGQLSEERWTEPLDLRVRMALHTGNTQRRNGNYFGPSTNRAARLLSVAAAGQIVVSRATFDDLGRRLRVRLVDIGDHRLRGVAQPMRVFLVDTRPGPPPRRCSAS